MLLSVALLSEWKACWTPAVMKNWRGSQNDLEREASLSAWVPILHLFNDFSNYEHKSCLQVPSSPALCLPQHPARCPCGTHEHSMLKVTIPCCLLPTSGIFKAFSFNSQVSCYLSNFLNWVNHTDLCEHVLSTMYEIRMRFNCCAIKAVLQCNLHGRYAM